MEFFVMIVQPRLASAVMLLRDKALPEQGQTQPVPYTEQERDLPGQGQAQPVPYTERGIEVFMVRRVISSDFMPDVYVFPGGSVSQDDAAAELSEGVCTPVAITSSDPEGRTALGKGIRAAAIRELFEEAGVLLAYRGGAILSISEEQVAHFDAYRQGFQKRAGSLVEMAHAENLMLATDHLGYFAHWITPEGMPKRFDTHFFITTAPAEQSAEYDRVETSEGIWIAPSEALARSERNEFPLVFATIHQLRELGAFGSVKEALEHCATAHVPTRIPVLSQEDGKVRVHLQEEAGNTWEVPEHMRKS